MTADFAGATAELYARHRRDLPADQALQLADRLGLQADDVVIDLGAGTGQLAVPLQRHCAAVVAVDPEPAMLDQLRRRTADRVMCMLDDDRGLDRIGRLLGRPAGGLVIGNALHWMNEEATFRAAGRLVGPTGGLAVVTQGPPLWWGDEPWQRAVREALEELLGPLSDRCGSDSASSVRRERIAAEIWWDVDVVEWLKSYAVDREWILGHLGSAMSAVHFTDAVRDAVCRALNRFDGQPLTERVVTTALVGRRRR